MSFDENSQGVIVSPPPEISGTLLSPSSTNLTYNLTARASIRITNLTTPCWMEMRLFPLDPFVGRLSGHCIKFRSTNYLEFKMGVSDILTRTMNSVLRGIDTLTLQLYHNTSCHRDGSSSSERPAFRIEYAGE